MTEFYNEKSDYLENKPFLLSQAWLLLILNYFANDTSTQLFFQILKNLCFV